MTNKLYFKEREPRRGPRFFDEMWREMAYHLLSTGPLRKEYSHCVCCELRFEGQAVANFSTKEWLFPFNVSSFILSDDTPRFLPVHSPNLILQSESSDDVLEFDYQSPSSWFKADGYTDIIYNGIFVGKIYQFYKRRIIFGDNFFVMEYEDAIDEIFAASILAFYAETILVTRDSS